MKTVKKGVTISYLIITLLFIVRVGLSFYDYNYSGYYTDKIINWSWLLGTGIVLILFWKKKAIKVYFFSLLGFVIVSVLPMAIPFFSIVYSFSTIDDYQQMNLNNNYRIERTKQQALSIERIYIYEKRGVLEKNICRSSYLDIIEKTLNVDRNTNSIDLEKIPIQNARLIHCNKDSIGIEYTIDNKTKLIYHLLNQEDGY